MCVQLPVLIERKLLNYDPNKTIQWAKRVSWNKECLHSFDFCSQTFQQTRFKPNLRQRDIRLKNKHGLVHQRWNLKRLETILLQNWLEIICDQISFESWGCVTTVSRLFKRLDISHAILKVLLPWPRWWPWWWSSGYQSRLVIERFWVPNQLFQNLFSYQRANLNLFALRKTSKMGDKYYLSCAACKNYISKVWGQKEFFPSVKLNNILLKAQMGWSTWASWVQLRSVLVS